jgi:hypothetical protein
VHVILRGVAAVAAGALVLAGGAGAASAAGPAIRPVISGLTPAKVSTAGDSTVIIIGKGFEDVSAVTFGGAAATSYTVNSVTKITAVAPAGTSGSAPVAVTTADGDSLVTNKTAVLYRTPLDVDTTGNPTAKAGGGPLVLTVTGGTLGSTAKEFAKENISVLLDKVKLPASYVDETHLKITVPPTPADSAKLAVLHDEIAGDNATITLAPVVTSLSVKYSTLAGGVKTTVKVAGANINDTTDFMFGENPADCLKEGSVANPSFVCWVPAAEEAGPVSVTFVSGSGTPSRYTVASLFSYTDN